MFPVKIHISVSTFLSCLGIPDFILQFENIKHSDFPQHALETNIQTLESVIFRIQKKNKGLFLTRFQIP